MSRKQLMILFLCFLLPSTVGSAIMSLMSLYARSLGADASQTGLWLAIAFTLLALTTMNSSWLSHRFGKRKLFITLAGAISAPVAFLMGSAQDIVQLGLLTTILWGLFGIATTMVTILTGLYADKEHRGRSFGLLGVAVALGQVIGGLSAGALVERWGFTALFLFAALLYVTLTLVSLALEDNRKNDETQAVQSVVAGRSQSVNGALILILIASVLAFSGTFVTEMIRPLAMDARQFGTTVITGTVAIAGLVNIPLPYIMGWLSDRVGRRGILFACYGLAATGVMLMIPASAVWHFWIAQALISLVNSGFSIGSALVTDLVEPSALQVSLSRFTSTRWIGAVLSFAGAGMAVDSLGIGLTLAATGLLVLAAVPFVRAACSPRLGAYAACSSKVVTS